MISRHHNAVTMRALLFDLAAIGLFTAFCNQISRLNR